MLSALQAQDTGAQMGPELRTQMQDTTEVQAGVERQNYSVLFFQKEELEDSNGSINLPGVEEFKVGTDSSSNTRNSFRRNYKFESEILNNETARRKQEKLLSYCQNLEEGKDFLNKIQEMLIIK